MQANATFSADGADDFWRYWCNVRFAEVNSSGLKFATSFSTNDRSRGNVRQR